MNLDHNKTKRKGVEYLSPYALKLKDLSGKLPSATFISQKQHLIASKFIYM